MSKIFLVFQAIFLCVLAVVFFFYMRTKDSFGSTYVVAPVTATTTLPVSAGDLPLINPGVTANIGKHYIINFKPLEDEFKGIQASYPEKTYAYFVYLNNDAWIGINESDLFNAASTVKVPLAMSIMKMVENGQLSLSQSYTLGQLDLDSNFGTLYKVGSDNSFTLEELMQIMLENSDNTAMNAIKKAANLVGVSNPFSEVYDFMGWGGEDFDATPNYNEINLKTLSNMFIALYNATYDDPQDSDLILHYLDDSVFSSGIPAGVPQDISVADKIGVNDTNKTYSDCGIVYVPDRNFLICLGSVGADQKTADTFMAEMTKAAYDYVMNN